MSAGGTVAFLAVTDACEPAKPTPRSTATNLTNRFHRTRRWIVERSLSWLMRARRNSRGYERLPEHSEAHITWANITLMTRRLARAQQQRHAAEPLPLAV